MEPTIADEKTKAAPKSLLLRSQSFNPLIASIIAALLIGIGIFVVLRSFAATGMCTQVAQHGITWTFDKPYPCGTFANGDYWVTLNAGDTAVRITSISPDYITGRNGWEVNPNVNAGDQQGFDARIGGSTGNTSFTPAMIPALPYNAAPGQSVVKTVSAPETSTCAGFNASCIQTAAVLTVVASPPPGDGATVFRPPYIGTAKPYYYVSQLKTSLLPSKPSVESKMTLDVATARFKQVRLDHLGGRYSRQLRPIDSMPNYGGDNAVQTGDGALALMLDDPLSAKMPALTAYVQAGIDWNHMLIQGEVWGAGAGHDPGHKLPIVFAATLLDDATLKSKIAATPSLHEDSHIRVGKEGRLLWGGAGPSVVERNYWETLKDNSAGNKSQPDPYGYIDGGNLPSASYQKITAQPYKAIAIAHHLMPEMKSLWASQTLLDYADRWVNFGFFTQSDPCAPVIYLDPSFSTNYGVKYGPDGQGSCIKDTDASNGIGRFPALHGTSKDTGNRYSLFVKSMWNAYRGTASTTPPPAPTPPPVPGDTTAPTASLSTPAAGATISGTAQLTASASDAVGVTKVEFYQGASKLGEDVSSPYSYGWNTTVVANGAYSLTAKAYDAAGNVGTSQVVNVTVKNITTDTTLPVVTITAPTSGATLSGTVTISAKATDNVGVVSLQIFIDNALYASASSSYLSTTWNTKPKRWKGTHTITVKAKDSAGNVGTKSVTVTVR